MNYNACTGRVYKIKSGDTLYNISAMFDVPLPLLLQANPYVDIYNMQVGDTICIPSVMNPPIIGIFTYQVKDQETINDILNRFQIELEDLIEYNKEGMMIMPGTVLQIPAKRPTQG